MAGDEITYMWEFIQQQFQNQIFTGVALGGFVTLVVNAFRSTPKRVWETFINHFTVSVRWNSFDPLYPAVQEWLHSHNFHRWRRAFQATTIRAEHKNTAESLAESIPKTVLAPYNGAYTVKIDGQWVRILSSVGTPSMKEGIATRYEEVTIRYFGRSLSFINQIISEIRELSKITRDRGIPVFIPMWSSWMQLKTAPPRTLDSIILHGETLTSLCNDIDRFLHREEEYIRFGVPFRRGYLFSGTPGTGKTSTIMAVASSFQLPLYVLPLTEFIRGGDENSSQLIELMTTIYTPAIILIEDIDRVRSTMGENAAKSPSSVLINLLDGVIAKHGVITIITTNDPDAIDPVLKRPGRVDEHIEFTTCDSDMARRMVRRFQPHLAEEESEAFASQLVGLSPAAAQGMLLQDTLRQNP